MSSQSSSSTTATYAARAYAQANPIDLTLEDDDDDIHVAERMPKRQCTLSRSFNAGCSNPPDAPFSAYSRQSSSGLSPAMSHSSLAPHSVQNAPSGSRTPQLSPSSSYYRDNYENNSVNALRAPFQGPSNSSAFFQPSNQAVSLVNPLEQPPPSQLGPNGGSPYTSQAAARQVIDLTGSPSPPPGSRPPHPPPQPLPPPQLQPTLGNLPMDLPPKTPVCIGVLPATALVLYPIPYLNPPDYGSQDYEWAPVRLQYEHVENKPIGQSETINIRPPSVKGLNGEIIPGETFSVVEQKIATHLGPMLGKGLIRLDAKIRRGNRTLPILQMQMLVFTPKGNIPVVSQYLHSNGLYLDHPTLPCDIQHASSGYYFNPHNPPPGGHSRGGPVPNRPGYMGPGGNTFSRWSVPAVSGRSVEVQRSQVDELFKSLKGGDELDEADSPPEVATKLYPHQLKALTFLLAREQELGGVSRRQMSLWQERLNPLSHQASWINIVTQAEELSKPFEAKGAILADDMGLGKTITCLSLIAATFRSARAFAETPLTPPPTPPPRSSDTPLTASHFQGSVWGIPPPSIEPHASSSSSSKANKKMAREQDRMEVQYTRVCRIKMKSRATLIICPLSTVVNWEDQLKEHWRGEVTVCGGQSGVPPPASQPSTSGLSTPTGSQLDIKAEEKKPSLGRIRDGPVLRVYVYHGNARRLEPTFLADFDAVITTYATLASEFSRQTKSLEAADDEDDEDVDGVSSEGFIEVDGYGQPVTKSKGKKAKKRKKAAGSSVEATSPLQSIHWFRVVLDEAHSIKETNTVGCRASCDLIADRRLCLTGTPVQNKLDDVFALIKFLRLTPFDDKNTWNEFIGTPVKYAQPLGIARLQTIMKCITLRRTKESRAEDGKKILSLPPRTDELRYLKFDQQEQSIYDQFFNESKAEFHELSHKNEVMKNYVGILQKILRLRQICDHFELVQNKGLGLPGDALTPYEDVVATVAREGIDLQRGAIIFALLKEAGTTQCVECQCELSASLETTNEGLAEVNAAPAKRGRKPKASASTSRASTRQNSPTAPQPVLTRCQHLFCAECFRTLTFPGWPNVQPDAPRACAICQTALLPNDAVQLSLDCAFLDSFTSAGAKKKAVKKEKRQKGIALEDFHPSTKVRALLGDLIQFSKANPYSANYDPNSVEVQMVDGQGNCIDDGVTKTVVFSQWTSMLDKVEDALEVASIRYDRLDGTMKRDERTRAMEALKHDPGCEVLLVSLKAGGVGLNLTAAQRVYLMDPYWNPAVENQAVDRIHRLGQTRPVTTVKLIIDNTIEARLLEVQKKKTELANLTLGPPLSKSDIQARRMEELHQLFAS